MAIFNHLDINVLVHPTLLTDNDFTYDNRKDLSYSTKVYDQKIELSLPRDQFRIVGFEVRPRSVPKGYACTEEQFDHGHEILMPGEDFEFTYSVNFEISNKDWPTRLDHYLKF